MNYLIKIFFAIIAIASFSGCSKDLLDTIPNDRISTEIFWKTDKDATLAGMQFIPILRELIFFHGMGCRI